MNAPETFDQALALAVSAATEYLNRKLELLTAQAYRDMCQDSLTYIVLRGYAAPAFLNAEHRLQQAELNVQEAEHWVGQPVGQIEVWDSGWQFDDSGNEYSLSVLYDPREFAFQVRSATEGGEYHGSDFGTAEEAIAHAQRALYPEELESQPAPTISSEESAAAGETIIHFQGQRLAIKSVVDKALDAANQGCGQHYELFARRARSALGGLHSHVRDPGGLDALAKYLAYDRF